MTCPFKDIFYSSHSTEIHLDVFKQGKISGFNSGFLCFAHSHHILPELRDVLGRRVAEEPAIFAGELGGADISHLPAGDARVHHGGQHQTPGFLEAKGLLELEGAQGRDRLEVHVESGNAHVRQLGQFLDLDGLGEMAAKPSDRFLDAVNAGIHQS